MKISRVITLMIGLLACDVATAAQNIPNSPPIRPTPDCILTPTDGGFTATGASPYYDNRGMGCTTWHLVYNNTGYSALNIAPQSADDSGGIPGSFSNWGTSGGTLSAGTTLPLTAITSGQATGYKYRPFVRVNLSSATGSGRVSWMLYGYRPGNGDSNGGNGAVVGTSGLGISDGMGNVSIGGWSCISSAGVLSTCAAMGVAQEIIGSSLYDVAYYCDQSIPISNAAAATTQLIALSGTKKIRVCSFLMNGAGATTVKLQYGTGSNCGTGTTDLTGAMTLAAGTNIGAGAGGTSAEILRTPNGQALCLVNSVAVQVSGFLTFQQR